jgi:hypothetical protein
MFPPAPVSIKIPFVTSMLLISTLEKSCCASSEDGLEIVRKIVK